jgi:hypothetical protein
MGLVRDIDVVRREPERLTSTMMQIAPTLALLFEKITGSPEGGTGDAAM